jgi:two-component system cell cycle sensor histidine kinase/response regulator CckA
MNDFFHDGGSCDARSTIQERTIETASMHIAQMEKAAAIGQIACGIVHDFNNILAAARSFADLIALTATPGTDQHDYVGRIVAACELAAEMVDQINTLADIRDAPRERVHIAAILGQARALLSGILPTMAALSVTDNTENTIVIANRSQLVRVLMNIAINAGDAMEGRPGEIAISSTEFIGTQHEPFGAGGFTFTTGQLRPDTPYVKISVVDTGRGIPRDIAAQIFEPFFTTKNRQKGSGLGLAIVKGIVDAHDGIIALQSSHRGGTAFHIYLPNFCQPTSVPERHDAQDELLCKFISLKQVPPRRAKQILVVDDHADMADVLSYALTRLKYEAIRAYSPVEAINLFHRDPGAWDLVVADQTMPGMTGVHLIRRIKLVRPDIKAILCTGLGEGLGRKIAGAEMADSIRAKPIAMDDLAADIHRLLEGEGQRSQSFLQ